MPTEPLDDVALEQKIQAELARRGWSLAAEPSLFAAGETFLLRVRQRTELWCVEKERPLDDALIHIAITHEYCRLLHAAVSQNSSRVQGVALQETINYAWPAALKRCSDQRTAESAILRAVTNAWLHIAKCKPGSYLAWFTRILQREIQQEYRTQGRIQGGETTEADLPIEQDNDEIDDDRWESVREQMTTEADSAHTVEQILSRERLVTLLKKCLSNAKREFIILAEFFAELNPVEIARMLGVKVSQVHLNKFRALKRIKHCPDVLEELRLQVS